MCSILFTKHSSDLMKNLMGFASVKFNDCFVVENLKIVQGSKGLFLGMPSQPDGKGGYRDMAYPLERGYPGSAAGGKAV